MRRTVWVLGCFCAGVAWGEVDIDALCPPRAETAATFEQYVERPPARSYAESSRMAYAYMTALPAMTTLVRTGEPEQTYQHNAYVSKTHAAHIQAMLAWAQSSPANRETALQFARASAEYLLTQLEPADAPLAYWPPTYGREPLRYNPETDGPYYKPSMVGNEPEGAVKYRGQVMLIYPADVALAFLEYYGVASERKYLDAAVGIAETYLRIRRTDGTWPLKMKLATAEVVGENTLVPVEVLMMFEALQQVTGDVKWQTAADETFAWLDAHPLTDWNWDGQFEDVNPLPPYQNPTHHSALKMMEYLLRRFPDDPARRALARRLLEFSEKRFVCWTTPAGHAAWPAPSALEQYSCFTPIDSSSARFISAYMAFYRAESNTVDLAKARALANTITRVQKASGRIPTFWDGVATGAGLSTETYDWLNCMQYTARVLLQVPDPPAYEGRQVYVAPGGTGDYTQANPGGDVFRAVSEKAVRAGDVVHLLPGTYDLAGRETMNGIHLSLQPGVSLVGETDDPERVRLVGDGTRRVVYCLSTQDDVIPNRLCNVTITGGHTVYQGGGVCGVDHVGAYCASNCIVENCSAAYQGGGAFRGTWHDSTFRHCSIFQHANGKTVPSLWDASGGGAFGGTYYGCTIVSNTSCYGGGGLGGGGQGPAYANAGVSDPSLVARAYRCTIAFNSAPYGAGAFSHDPAGLSLTDCVIVSNATPAGATGERRGGGAQGATLLRCRVVGNVSAGYGGGCFACEVAQSVIAQNESQYGGAGFQGTFRSCTLIGNLVRTFQGAACYNCDTYNCLVTGNRAEASQHGRGVLCRGYHQGDLVWGNRFHSGGVFAAEAGTHNVAAVNCTIADNEGEVDGVGCADGFFTNCVVAGQSVDFASGVQAKVACKSGAEAGFVGKGLSGVSRYGLRADSACRDAGLPFPWMAGAKDVAGVDRVVNGVPDVGALEWTPTCAMDVRVR